MAERSVDYADRSRYGHHPMASRTTLADVLHQAGERARAKALFQEAERLQAEWQPEYRRLYSLWGYCYCDLLLDLGGPAEVRDRASYALDVALRGNRNLLDMALNHLSLGRAEVLAFEANATGDLLKADDQLSQAVNGFRKAGTIHQLPRGLLARAAYLRVTRKYDPARRDLDEALRIATRSGMRLHECDAHLEFARLELAQGNHEAARTHLSRAEQLVAGTGYHRRDREIEELKAALG